MRSCRTGREAATAACQPDRVPVDEDPGVASRAADALERATGRLQPGSIRGDLRLEGIAARIDAGGSAIRLRWNLH